MLILWRLGIRKKDDLCLTIVALSSVCLFEMRRQQAQFSYMTSITNTSDKIELNVWTLMHPQTNQSLSQLNASLLSSSRAEMFHPRKEVFHWRDTILWWHHKKPNSQFLWLHMTTYDDSYLYLFMMLWWFSRYLLVTQIMMFYDRVGTWS